jgi:hypothetical protein
MSPVKDNRNVSDRIKKLNEVSLFPNFQNRNQFCPYEIVRADQVFCY